MVVHSTSQPATALTQYLQAAGIPVDGVSYNGTAWVVYYQAAATPAQVTQGNAIVASFDGKGRVSRPLPDIYTALGALTTTQQQTVWSDLVSKLPSYTGPSAASIWSLYSVATDIGVSGVQLNNIRRRCVALYVYDNPLYLYKPSLDPTIDVEGWVPQ